MSKRVLQTKRLKMRPLNKADAVDITRLIGVWDVAQWLTSPPFPYTLEDAHQYLCLENAGRFAIEHGGDFIGAIGLHPVGDETRLELGYWLGKPFWGQGFMTEAVTAVVQDQFARSNKALISGYMSGNDRSKAILTKLGFRNTKIINSLSRPHAKEMPLQRMELTLANWAARNG